MSKLAKLLFCPGPICTDANRVIAPSYFMVYYDDLIGYKATYFALAERVVISDEIVQQKHLMISFLFLQHPTVTLSACPWRLIYIHLHVLGKQLNRSDLQLFV